MAVLKIPGIGEETGITYMRQMTWGHSDESPDVTCATGGTEPIISITEANVFVEKLEAQVVVANTGTTVLIIGDGDNTDGWWTNALYGVGSSAAVYNSPDSSVGYAAGKLYTSSDTIDIVFTGLLAAGKNRMRITYHRGADTDLIPDTSS